jgi:hypothetical protein
MASDRFVLTRPIEVGDANDGFRVDYDGGGWSNLTITQGVYGSIATFMQEVETKLDTVNANFSVSLSSDFFINITNSTATFKIDWQADTVGQTLGFDADCEPVAQVFTATQIPRYCWLPTNVRDDRNTWSPNHTNNFKGAPSQSGIVSGLSSGKVLYFIKVVVPMEYVYNLRQTHCRTAAEQVRCLDYFLEGSRVSNPSSGNVSSGGFYFWPDYTDVDCLASMDAGDVTTFNYTSGADTYVFCEFDPSFDAKIKSALPAGWTYQTIEIPIQTSAYPTGGWSAP